MLIQNPDLDLGDDTTKIILNIKGIMDDVTQEMKKLLDLLMARSRKVFSASILLLKFLKFLR